MMIDIDPRDAEIERLAQMVIEAESYHGYHQQACLEIERLTQKLAHHEAHEYELRAWAAEARVEELTRKLNPPFAHDALCDGPCLDVTCLGCVTATHDDLQRQLDTAIAQIAALREELIQARFDILTLKNARWSEAKGSDADWVGHIDAVLTTTEPAKESE